MNDKKQIKDKKQLISILRNSKDIVIYQPNAREIPIWDSNKRKFFIQDDNGHLTIRFNKIVDEIYKQGYQKIDEGLVVLRRQEYGKLKAEVEDLTIYIKDYKFRNQELQKSNEGLAKNIEELEIEADELRDKLAQAHKQAVKEVLGKIKEEMEQTIKSNYIVLEKKERICPIYQWAKGKIDALRCLGYFLDEIAKEFGVEV